MIPALYEIFQNTQNTETISNNSITYSYFSDLLLSNEQKEMVTPPDQSVKPISIYILQQLETCNNADAVPSDANTVTQQTIMSYGENSDGSYVGYLFNVNNFHKFLTKRLIESINPVILTERATIQPTGFVATFLRAPDNSIITVYHQEPVVNNETNQENNSQTVQSIKSTDPDPNDFVTKKIGVSQNIIKYTLTP